MDYSSLVREVHVSLLIFVERQLYCVFRTLSEIMSRRLWTEFHKVNRSFISALIHCTPCFNLRILSGLVLLESLFSFIKG